MSLVVGITRADRGASTAAGSTGRHMSIASSNAAKDLSPQEIDGDRVSILLEEANIIVNKNRVPGDKGMAQKPFGFRLRSPALTTREP